MSGENKATVYDFSVNLWDSADGMMKAGSQTMFYKKSGWDLKNLAVRRPGPESYWLAKRDQSLSLHPVKYLKGEDAGYVLGGTDGAQAMHMLYAIMGGDPMQVSLSYKGDRYNNVVAFKNAMNEDDKAILQGCLAGLLKTMDAEAERLDAAGPPAK